MVVPIFIEGVRNPNISDIEFNAGIEDMKQKNIHALWEAATKYEQSYISGSAIGLLTVGTLRQLPKSLAIQNWILSIWNGLYYPRKTLVTYAWDNSLYDFSSCGPMPYSIPELTQEVLGV